jgi:hypothetical protein
MINYKKAAISSPDFNEPLCVIGIDAEGRQYGIPFDPDNTDYQEYLKWLAEGNTPLAFDALMPQENGDTFTLSA